MKFNPVNDNLLCEKVVLKNIVGGLVIPDMDKLRKQARVIATSEKLSPFADKYDVGDVVIYTSDAREFQFGIDGKDYIVIKKTSVVTKIVEDE